jgi:hypothetical protein
LISTSDAFGGPYLETHRLWHRRIAAPCNIGVGKATGLTMACRKFRSDNSKKPGFPIINGLTATAGALN